MVAKLKMDCNCLPLSTNTQALTQPSALSTQPLAVYIHTPFCPSKCGYCDFNSYAMSGEIMSRTTEAMVEEIRRSPWAGIPAKTIFFGGGTPTYLPIEQLVLLLQTVMKVHPPGSMAKPSVECGSEA